MLKCLRPLRLCVYVHSSVYLWPNMCTINPKKNEAPKCWVPVFVAAFAVVIVPAIVLSYFLSNATGNCLPLLVVDRHSWLFLLIVRFVGDCQMVSFDCYCWQLLAIVDYCWLLSVPVDYDYWLSTTMMQYLNYSREFLPIVHHQYSPELSTILANYLLADD